MDSFSESGDLNPIAYETPQKTLPETVDLEYP